MGSELRKLGDKSHSVQDLFDGVSKGEYGRNGYVKWSHSKPGYWDNVHRLGNESFAHMFEASFDPDKVQLMEQYFPESWEKFNKILIKRVK